MKFCMMAIACLLMSACNRPADTTTVRRDPTTGQATDVKSGAQTGNSTSTTITNKPVVDPLDPARDTSGTVGPRMTANDTKPVVRDADNSGQNKVDKDMSLTKTPIDQNENRKDIDITAAIRKQVVDTKMSINAQNVKIITADGKVTLRGAVKSDEEKQRIEKIAQEVAGNTNVDNQISVELDK